MENNIIRHYPYCKSQIKNIEYPNRTNIINVNIIKELTKDKDYNDDYIKWISGINYKSKTKNKIKIGGNLHIKLGHKFILQHIINYRKYCVGDLNYYSYSNNNILFNHIDSIDWDTYFLETEQIYNNINNENMIINENNKKVIEYNNNINEVIKKINKLENWDEFIEFQEKKYGISYIYNNIHRENNCFGLIKKDYYKECSCSTCENWNGCNRGGTQYYKCENCDYTYFK